MSRYAFHYNNNLISIKNMNLSKSLIFQLLLLVLISFVSTAKNTQRKKCSARLAQPDSIVSTEYICPRHIHVGLDDLPKPYSSESASKPFQLVPVPEDATLKVPDGFSVNVFEAGLNGPRWLALTPNGDILVTETTLNRISILRDEDGDGVADVNEIFAGPRNGLNQAFGMLFVEGYIYIANTDEIRRFSYEPGQRQINGTGERIANLSGGGSHWTRDILLSPDGQQIYVSIGSRENIGIDPPNRASVWSMNLDGSNQSVFASGLRNPVGLATHPKTKELYVVVNERDGLGDDLVPDYFTRIRKGEFFGWPYAYLSPDNLDPRELDDNGQSKGPELAAKTITPDVLFQSHSAPLGLVFSTGKTFPRCYRHGAFVAFHGSWNRDRGTGYKIVFVPFDKNNRPAGYYFDFVSGFLDDPSIPTAWARPTGLLVLPDGSLIFTDEGNGRIYRVQYQC